jgi:hypothetical protein
MAYNYIRRAYSVDPRVGQRITMDGKPGTIIRPQGDPQYLNVRFDGQKHGSNVHPTWKVDYAPKESVP